MLYSWLQCCVLEYGDWFYYPLLVIIRRYGIHFLVHHYRDYIPAGTVLLSCSIAMAADVVLVCQGLPSTILLCYC